MDTRVPRSRHRGIRYAHDEKGGIRLSSAPTVVLLVATATLGFQSLIFGSSLVENSLLPTIDMPSCSDLQATGHFLWWDTGNGPLSHIACWVRSIGIAIANFFIMLASVVAFFWNALTFNIDGAPMLVRVFMGTISFGSVGWAIASLTRGTKA